MRKQVWCTCVLTLALIGFVGASEAATLYLGLPGGTSVAFTKNGSRWVRAANADLPDVGSSAAPAFADLDGDRDRDVLVGESGGHVRAFVNTGSDGAPIWVRQTSWEAGLSFADRPAPALADLDGDGDVDLLVGAKTGVVRAFENVGSSAAPAWREHDAWSIAAFDAEARPAFGDFDHDGRVDLVVAYKSGAVHAFAGTGDPSAPFVRRPQWEPALDDTRIAVALGDADGDGRDDLFVTNGLAATTILTNTGSGWTPSRTTVPDPGSGPAVPAFVRQLDVAPAATPGATTSAAPRTATPKPTATATPRPTATAPAPSSGATPAPAAPGAPVARLSADRTSGGAPLTVRFDAGASVDAQGDPLSFSWDFGDGSVGGGEVPDDPAAAITAAKRGYGDAKATRNAGHYDDAAAQYLVNVDLLVPLTTVAIDGPVKAQGTKRIDRVARWYLQKTGHDLGGMYLSHSVGLSTCDRYATALQYSRESEAQAIAGGFPALPASNGTTKNIATATTKLTDKGCPIPPPRPMFPVAGTSGDPVIVHRYASAGAFTARVTVSDGAQRATASLTIVVGDGGPASSAAPTPQPTAAPPSDGGGDEPLEGFGATTRGGEGGRTIRITEPTDAAVRAAFKNAASGSAVIVFEVAGPIPIDSPLPILSGNYLTVEGNGVSLVGTYGNPSAALVDVRGHDVIVRNMRLRNGGDNLRAQTSSAYDVVFSHISSSGAGDDGISIGYGAHDVTVQYCFLAGNTRSLFLKYGTTTHVSIHHTWVMKQWIRGPLVSTGVMADLRNLIVEDWALWGTRFEANSSGNIVNSLFRLGAYAKSIGGKPKALNLIQSGEVFSAGNVYEGLATEQRDQRSAPAPLNAPPVTTLGTDEMVDVVEQHAGCMPRDAVDQAYIDTHSGWHVGESKPFRITP